MHSEGRRPRPFGAIHRRGLNLFARVLATCQFICDSQLVVMSLETKSPCGVLRRVVTDIYLSNGLNL